jgi:fructose-1,6-bisphosphatase/inositol monophosphatase family enzyme
MPAALPHADVEALMREAAERVIAPRFRTLQAHDVSEKSPGELVTVVDREAEALLTPALRALRPGSQVVGEEACAEQPQLLQQLDRGEVWLVDPLDGTSNFVAGRPTIAILVALLRDGETVAGWMMDPLTGTMHRAERGAGAWRGDERLQCSGTPDEHALRGTVKMRYLPPELQARVAPRTQALGELQADTGCAGCDYPAVVHGHSDFTFFWRTLPWDHAAGVLFLQEAGGHAARLDGSAYRAGDPRTGLLVASSLPTWHATRRVLAL